MPSGNIVQYLKSIVLKYNEIENNLVDNFDMMKEWFIKYFYNNSLENFVDVPKGDEKYNVQVKVGRITNAINGKYKTF